MNNFLLDLKLGQTSEVELSKILINKGWDVEFNTSDDIKILRLWDIKAVRLDVTVYIEVKTDLLYKKTGNVAIEWESIHNSSADIIVYKLGDEFYQITKDKLMSNLGNRFVWGGDGNRTQLALIKVDKFKEMSKIITNE